MDQATLSDGRVSITFPVLDSECRHDDIEVTPLGADERWFIPGLWNWDVLAADHDGRVVAAVRRWVATRPHLTLTIGQREYTGLRLTGYSTPAGAQFPVVQMSLWAAPVAGGRQAQAGALQSTPNHSVINNMGAKPQPIDEAKRASY